MWIPSRAIPLLVLIVGLAVSCGLDEPAGPASSLYGRVDCSRPFYVTDCGERLVDVLSPEGVSLEVLSSLPRHPGSTELPTDADSGFATDPHVTSCGGGGRCPRVLTALEKLGVEASEASVKEWLGRQLLAEGYRDSGGGGGLSQGRPWSWLDFFHLAEPDVSVQPHFYPREDGRTVVDVLVVYLEPLPKPDGPVVPENAERVEIHYGPNDTSHVISDRAVVGRLAELVNGLNVRPDHTCWSRLGEAPSATELTFTLGEETWHVTMSAGECPGDVRFESYPTLHSPRNLLSEAIGVAIGEREPYDLSEWTPPGPIPTPLSGMPRPLGPAAVVERS